MKRLCVLLLLLGVAAPAAGKPVDGDLDPDYQNAGTYVWATNFLNGGAVAVDPAGRLLAGYTFYDGLDYRMQMLRIPDQGAAGICGIYDPDLGGDNSEELSDMVRDGNIVYLAGSADGPAADPERVVAIGAINLATCSLTAYGGPDGALLGAAFDLLTPDIAVTTDGELRVAVEHRSGESSELVTLGLNSSGTTEGGYLSQVVDFFAGYDAVSFEPRDMAQDPLGRLVVVGTIELADGDRDVGVVRMLPTGALDSSYSGDGLATFAYEFPDSGDDEGNAVALLPGGRIVVSGSTTGSPTTQTLAAVAVLTPTGGYFNDFGHFGRYTFQFQVGDYTYDSLDALAIQGDGKIVAVGVAAAPFSVDWGIARLLTTGDEPLDSTFSGNGHLILPGTPEVDTFGEARAVTLAQGGKISVVGTATGADLGTARFWNSYIFVDGFEWGVLVSTEWSVVVD